MKKRFNIAAGIKIPARSDDNGQVSDTMTARRILLKKCFMTYVISICVINYATSVKNAL